MQLKKYLLKAQKEGFALGAFNAANLETIKAIVGAAVKLSAPIIIECSPGESAYIEPENFALLIKEARDKTQLPIFSNLDHGNSLEAVKIAIKAGFDMVHLDGSKLPFHENVRLTKQAVQTAQASGVVAEGELGQISGQSQIQTGKKIEDVQKEGVFTDPQEASEFVKLTGVDVLATFVGNVHGIYQGAKKLDLIRLQNIQQSTKCLLSLHGGSTIPETDIQKAISYGVVKINVNTELRVAYKRASQQVFAGTNKEVAIYKLMPPVIEAVQKVVENKVRMFGSENKI